MHSLAHILRHKKSIIRAARLQARWERGAHFMERCIVGLCIITVAWLIYHAGAFVARQPVAQEKIQLEHWAGQKMTELSVREKALVRKESRERGAAL